MSSTSEHAHSGGQAELPCEPDDVPVRFLTIISAAVTLMVLVLIGIAVWLFNVTTASELAAKGYSVESSVPVKAAPAAEAPAAPAAPAAAAPDADAPAADTPAADTPAADTPAADTPDASE